MSDFFLCLFYIIASLLVVCYLQPWFIIALIPILAAYLLTMEYYRRTSRELGRLVSISSSPVNAQFQETMQGVSVIRAFDKQEQMREEIEEMMKEVVKANCAQQFSFRWLGVRVDMIGNLIYVVISLLFILTRGKMEAGMIGLTFMYASYITGDINWFVRASTTLEAEMNKVERLIHYSNTPSERPIFREILKSKETSLEDTHSPLLFEEIEETFHGEENKCILSVDDPRGREWPFEGKIEFDSVFMKYSEEGKNVLEDVSFTILPKEKIGIVGRTGAGKVLFFFF